MKTNIAAPIGGLIILAGALALAAYTGTQAPALERAHAASVGKYLALSDKALKSGEASQAEKFVKKALIVDPTSKAAIAELKKIALLSCPKTAAGTPASTEKTPPAAAAPKEAAQPEAESEEEMGCI